LRRKRAERDGRPFFLCVSFTHPHDPFIIAEEYWSRYRDEEVEPPRAGADDPPHAFNGWINAHHGMNEITPDAGQVRRSRRAYYGMVSYVDDKVGEWVAELARLGLADDTLIVFTSDHGEMLGEHGMWFKRTFYDGAAKVPMIVARPGDRTARRVRAVISLVDLFPTLLELAGIEAEGARFDGRSFAPLLDGDARGARDTAFCEYCGEGAIAPMRFIRKGRHKYVYVHGQSPALFDLENDPEEQSDLHGRGEFAALARALEAELLADWDPELVQADVLRSQRERLMIGKALRTGKTYAWDWRE
jgi:choline-sulfatase